MVKGFPSVMRVVSKAGLVSQINCSLRAKLLLHTSNSVGNGPREWFSVALDHNSVDVLHMF